MTPYFAHAAATAVPFGITIGVWILLELRQSMRRRGGSTMRDRGSYHLVGVAVAAGWLATALVAARVPAAAMGGQPAPLILGLIVAWAGIALRWWSFHTLGSYFTFRVQTSADQPVITTGPYRVLRHPGYSGMELALLGIALMYGNWIGLAAMAILPMLGLVNRIRIEENALRNDLGDAYRQFAAARKRMIPAIW